MLQTDTQVECRPWPPPSGWYLPLSRGVKVSLRSSVRRTDGRGRRGLSHQPYKYCSFEGLSLGSDRLGKPGPPRTSTGETGPTKRYPHITRKMEPEGSTGGSWGLTADGWRPNPSTTRVHRLGRGSTPTSCAWSGKLSLCPKTQRSRRDPLALSGSPNYFSTTVPSASERQRARECRGVLRN